MKTIEKTFKIVVYNNSGVIDLDVFNKELNSIYNTLTKSNLSGEVGYKCIVELNGYKLDYRMSLIVRSDKSGKIKFDFIPTKRNVDTLNDSLANKNELPSNFLLIIEDSLSKHLHLH